MRIAIVSREVVPFFGAGIGTYVAAMAHAWRYAGHEVHIVSQDHREFAKRGSKELDGATCHGVRVPNSGYFFSELSAGARHTLLKLHARSPFDYIEFPDYFAEGYFAIRGARLNGELAGAVLGVRLHTPTHECRLLNDEGPGGPEIGALEECETAAIRGADVVISPSCSLLSMVRDRTRFGAPGRVIPYPFNVGRAVSAASSSTVPTQRPSVLYVGRLERRKGVELLVDAGQQLLRGGHDISFRLIGGDTNTGPHGRSMRSHLVGQIEPQWRDRFAFKSHQLQEEVLWMIRSVALGGGVCCFPSRWENFPNVCLEAMSLGSPVVGSDAGGMSEIIEDGLSGVLFRSGDAKALESALESVLKDEPLRHRLSIEAPRRIAALCDPATVVGQTIDAILAARLAPGFGKQLPFEDVALPGVAEASRMRRFAARWFS